MLRPRDQQSVRRRRIALATTALAGVLAAVTMGIWLSQGSETTATPLAPPSSALSASFSTETTESVAAAADLEQLPATSDPQEFAEAVASAAFAWDTSSSFPLTDYTGRLLAVADPTGESAPGLAADLAAYLPNAAAWSQLREYYTRQWLELFSSNVPDLWDQALVEAGDGLAPGTSAYTILGVRHRAGVWEGEPVTSAHAVAFTVFVVCEPTYPTCYLLRFSRLGEPLE
ncbi:cell wall protein [Nocardioides sp. YIM 152588]|uniref:cell wall protein n=1 Tax=Nocardioides sp. YIM 152588 TaxID=3158259 RepID=UPI0032E4C07E